MSLARQTAITALFAITGMAQAQDNIAPDLLKFRTACDNGAYHTAAEAQRDFLAFFEPESAPEEQCALPRLAEMEAKFCMAPSGYAENMDKISAEMARIYRDCGISGVPGSETETRFVSPLEL